jgi:undecaprenyl pyrophosphate phosphatase UppP
MLLPVTFIFYLLRKRRRKNDSQSTSKQKYKKFGIIIATIVALIIGLIIKEITGSFFGGAVTVAISEPLLLKMFEQKNDI